MGGRIDLREGFGFGGAGGVAAGAENGGIQLGWHHAGGISCVLGKRTMAGFAVDTGVLAFGLGVLNIGVAVQAGLVTGESDRARGHFVDGGGAVVSVLTEALGNHEAADQEKDQEGHHEESGKTEKMSCILEEVHAALSP